MKMLLYMGTLLMISTMVLAVGGMARPVGLGQEQGYDHARLTCPSCYDVKSPLSGTMDKAGMSVKGTMHSRGQQLVVRNEVGRTYAPNWYVGLDSYYRHRGTFRSYSAKRLLGADKGLSIVHSNSFERYQPARRVVPSYLLIDGKMIKVD